MSDENGGPRSPITPVTAASNISRKQTVSSPGATPSPAPSGHSIKRAVTVDESSQLRRRTPFGQFPTETSFIERAGLHRRRSSTLSDYSFGEARDLLNPKPTGVPPPSSDDMSNWASIPLAFALLPAVGGLLFNNGSAVVTDVMLLGLSAVFLHWSVTHPWNWYHSAQAVRVRAEVSTSAVIDDESENEQAVGSPSSTASTLNGHAVNGSLDDASEVPTTPTSSVQEPALKVPQNVKKDDALAELWVHEILALVSCFMFPMLGAYLLHAIRAQLSRPSEGLVSNYNLTIFLLAAELRPLSHMMKLVQCRTLQLQRDVHANPFKEEAVTPDQVRVLMARLELLESRPEPTPIKQNGNSDTSKIKQEAAIARDVRNAIQPDLDALNRAVRRYEKKATVLAFQTESRFAAVDTRLNDAIALAAAAAKNSAARPGFLQWLVESVWAIITMPFFAVVALLVLPFKTVRGLLKRKKKQLPERSSRSGRNGKTMGHRMATDRPPSRVSKR
ncbi:hypothetical protein CGMCC3_g16485 [Colletotrichum fructicola]|uniref:Uncharacterized protein n=1 Tax=Colletotrichum fructicola (strain Nara gc5) TaxID=1213859 RepID=L2FWX1_COLFN|nr:uncharacterized protein CGMCC3_g16485 [Colletotrichum fructicola]KAF4485127.1 hypothetical protein CGGC5_v007761 [Colletotrichum fructicola Nara gc5]KAI8285183.1 hypothetical protein K4K60_001430 [Colletotrichum sp. SAR11_57]KAJ0267889.1 hypothetical protein COL940_013929 [Colletotrichum noveboracense]KAE9567388.1 hypothetical protein CGMCC3_g16485 [Colletotrichum fructicola]KAF4416751.1 hypothetical protein CFRS1_v003754 [Colletotrichum fructicola]